MISHFCLYFRYTLRVLVSLLVFLPLSIAGQSIPFDIPFTHISEAEGLPTHYVMCVAKDKMGFLWIGTTDGLCRYDGSKIKTYRHVVADSNSIPNNWILALSIDANGNLWVGTEKGICVWNERKQQFQRIHFTHRDNLNQNVTAMTFDYTGTLWFGTSSGLWSYHTQTHKTQFYPFSFAQYGSEKRFSTLLMGKNCIWLGISTALVKFDLTQKTFAHFRPLYNGKMQNLQVTALKWNENNTKLWVGSWGKGLSFFDIQSYSFSAPISIHSSQTATNLSNTILDFDTQVIGNDSIHWVATTQGLAIYDTRTRTFRRFVHDNTKPKSLSCDYINQVMIDDKGILWAASICGGLNCYNRNQQKIHTADFSSYIPMDAYSEVIDILNADKPDTYWLLTEPFGLMYWDKAHNTFQPYFYKSKTPTFDKNTSLNAFFRVNADTILIGTNKGIDLFFPKKQSFSHWNTTDTRVNNANITSFFKDAKGNIWFSTYREGICCYNVKKKTFDWKEVYPGTYVKNIQQDSKGNYWFATHPDGVFCMDTNGKLHPFEQATNHALKGIAKLTGDIKITPRQEMWFTTEQEIVKWDLVNQKGEIIREINGQPVPWAYRIIIDKSENIWINTRKGLLQYAPHNNQWKIYSTQDGLHTNSLFQPIKMAEDGTLLIRMVPHNGAYFFQYFTPQSLQVDTFTPKVVLTEVKIMDNEKPWETYQNQAFIRLSPQENVITLSFASLNYNGSDKVQYAYQLEGFDANWVHCGLRNTVTYTNLDGGTYRFRMKAQNADGYWSAITTCMIEVKPPFWRAKWFYFLVLMTVAAIVFIFVRQKIKQAEKEVLIREISLKALRSQMNPHFIFNSLNAIDKYILMSDEQKASSYLHTFARLMRMILNHSEKSFIPLKEELRFLSHYIELENLRMEHAFSYQIHVQADVEEEIEIPSLLLQPYVENAIRHGLVHKGAPGKLNIEIKKSGARLHCIIEDDGIGREKAGQIQQQSSLNHMVKSMKITQDRLSLLNEKNDITLSIKDLQSDDGSALGTRVELWIPIH